MQFQVIVRRMDLLLYHHCYILEASPCCSDFFELFCGVLLSVSFLLRSFFSSFFFFFPESKVASFLLAYFMSKIMDWFSWVFKVRVLCLILLICSIRFR